jgi:hypothetical protein
LSSSWPAHAFKDASLAYSHAEVDGESSKADAALAPDAARRAQADLECSKLTLELAKLAFGFANSQTNFSRTDSTCA